jgi:hypothetical protein
MGATMGLQLTVDEVGVVALETSPYGPRRSCSFHLVFFEKVYVAFARNFFFLLILEFWSHGIGVHGWDG